MASVGNLVLERGEAALEKWTYQKDGAIGGPVGKDQLAALYEAGEITERTLVRSTTAGGGWQPYEKVAGVRLRGKGKPLPRSIAKFKSPQIYSRCSTHFAGQRSSIRTKGRHGCRTRRTSSRASSAAR